jgi:hypothetical protein
VSARLVQDVIEHSQARGSAYTLLLIMAHQANAPDEPRCWASAQTLSEQARLPRTTLYLARAELLELGEIAVLAEGGGRGKWTTYEIVLPGCQQSRDGAVAGVGNRPKTVPKPSRTRARPC